MAEGVLPFDRLGEITAQDMGAAIPEDGDGDLPCGVWKVSQAANSVGVTYDFAGIIRGRDDTERSQLRQNLIGKQNRVLHISPSLGQLAAFKVVEANEHGALGYFELLLRASLANG